MIHASSRPAPVASEALSYATCALCHTPSSLTLEAVAAGGAWRCKKCGQHWDGSRLAAVAAYAAWAVARARVGGKPATSDARATTGRDSTLGVVAQRAENAAAVSAWDNEGGPTKNGEGAHVDR